MSDIISLIICCCIFFCGLAFGLTIAEPLRKLRMKPPREKISNQAQLFINKISNQVRTEQVSYTWLPHEHVKIDLPWCNIIICINTEYPSFKMVVSGIEYFKTYSPENFQDILDWLRSRWHEDCEESLNYLNDRI